jgi:hypothetical protein
MPDGVVDALISLLPVIGGAIAGAGASVYVQGRKAKIDRQSAQLDAERDYVYEAHKRLYADFQPLLFQLAEACDSALRRFYNLAKASHLGALDLGPENWLNDKRDSYYRLSTIYRFMAPVVIFKLCQRRLTFVDLGVDEHLRKQYALARLIYQTWNDGHDLAGISPALTYLPRWRTGHASDDAVTSNVVQHIVLGELDLIAEAMTATDPDGRQRCMDFGEFREAYLDSKTRLHERASVAEALFTDFRPDRRPVLWRLLLCQATLWHAFIVSVSTHVTPNSTGPLAEIDRTALLWRRDGEATGADDVEFPLAAATAHARSELERAVQFRTAPDGKQAALSARRR